MSPPLSAALLCLFAFVVPMATATGAGQPQARNFFQELKPLPNDLARYQYLHQLMPQLSEDERKQARQFLAFADANLGLYRVAISDFPFTSAGHVDLAMPSPAQWRAGDAVEAIARLAAHRRIVMVNEAHHDPHTRLLTLALLPRLRAQGYTHFAAEALDERDTGLMRRGYPVTASGSEYLREPLYGSIVREAIRLGFVIVPYESSDMTPQIRENSQASNLYHRVFVADPSARLFVHAGYAHIDKAPGRLGEDIRPMAMELKRLSGFDPLSINQTEFRGVDSARQSPHYRQLVAAFHPSRAVVVLNRGNGKPWSAHPQRNDVSVILPPSSDTQRPGWLRRDRRRHAWSIDTALCSGTRPCVIEARPTTEPDDATPADRYTLLGTHEQAALYLRPGKYRVRAWGVSGRTLGERRMAIGNGK